MDKRSQAIANIRQWKANPVQFVRNVFQCEPDLWQQDVLMKFATNQRIAMQASKGVGKSTTLAWCIWNFLLTRPHPKIAITSISADNLRDGLGAELSKWILKSKLLQSTFEVTKTKIFAKAHPETWFCSFRSYSKSADPSQQANALAGLHADYILFVIDEVGGVGDSVLATAEAALASGVESKLLIAGNPTQTSGPLWRASTSEATLWHVVKINSDPDSPVRSPRVSEKWAREQIEKYGRDNDWVKVNVFGEFPSSSFNTLLGPDEVQAAMKRTYRLEQFDFAQKRLGVDVARFGSDFTVIFPRQGLVAYQPVEMQGARSNEIAARIMAAKSKWESEVEFIDGTGGYGSGVIDSLMQAGQTPQEVHFSGRPIDQRYFNKRSEMWFLMAEWIKRGGAIPNHPQLQKELTAPTYTFQNGKFRLEEKAQIKERLGFSPDFADALALTFAMPDMPRSMRIEGIQDKHGQLKYEYDPFE